MDRGGKAEKRRKEKRKRGDWDIEEKMAVKGSKTETHGGKGKEGNRKGFCKKIRKCAKNRRKNGKKANETPLYTYHAVTLFGIQLQNSHTFSGTFPIHKRARSDHQILVSTETGRYGSSEIPNPSLCATHCPVLLLKLLQFK